MIKNNIEITAYKHIIFDWNGTLLDDLWLAVEVIDKMLQKRGIGTMTEDRYRNIFDFPVSEYYRKIGFDFDKESFEKVGTEFIDEYNKRQYECRLHKGAKELLEFLKENNITTSILSARLKDSLIQNLEYYGIIDYFTEVAGLDDHYANGKNEAGKKLIENSGISPSKTLLIGDTLHDAEVADETGIDCILISAGHQSEKRLLTSNKPVFDSICNIFEKSVCN